MNSKIKRILISALVLLIAVAGGAYYRSLAQEVESFQINGSTLIAYTGSQDTIVVPDSVVTIGANAFAGNSVIKNVTLPKNLESIEASAFEKCTALEVVQIPDSVRSIANSAFDGCSNLTQVSIGEKLSVLGDGVFSDCDRLSTLTISPNNTYLKFENNALYNAEKAVLYQYLAGSKETYFRMPDTVQKIRPYAFWGCDNLKMIECSAGLERIDSYSMAACSALEYVIVHEPTREIGMGAFADDKNLRRVDLPISVTNILPNAFTPRSEELVFAGSPTSYAAEYATEQAITFADLSVLGSYVFLAEDTTNENASTDTDYEDSSGRDTENGNNHANSEAGAESYKQENSSAEEEFNLLAGEMIGDGTIVSDRVFVMIGERNPYNQQTAPLDANVTNRFSGVIPEYAYYENAEITEFPGGTDITRIEQLAFARSNIRKVDLPSGLEEIGYGAFYHCDHLEEVNIPDSVRYIGPYAFHYTPWLANWYETGEDDFLVVGDGILIAYKGQDAVVILPNEVKHIAGHAFENNQNVVNVVMPPGLRTIEEEAFLNCANLAQINGAYSLTDAGVDQLVVGNAFEGCRIDEAR